MNDPIDLFKHFKNPAESGRKHRSAISKFLKDDEHSVLAITSIQGSGKTTAIIDEFAKSEDGILLTQSNDKIDELVRIINNRYPELEYKAIYGLERACRSYRADDGIKKKVGKLRNIGILTEDIHRMICEDEECGFLTQDKEMTGRIIESVARFEAQITFGKQYHDLHSGRIIFIDEADGLLNQMPTSIPVMPYKNERLQIDSLYLPKIYRIESPEGTVTELLEQYKQLLKKGIEENETQIKYFTDLIRLITQKFYSLENNKISELSPIFFIFNEVLEKRMKLVIGTASMRNHRINFHRMNDLMGLAHTLTYAKNLDDLTNGKMTTKQLDRYLQIDDSLRIVKPEILEFEADFIPGFIDVFVLQSNSHSYSNAHYKRAFRSNDEELKRKTFKELRSGIIAAVRFCELQSGRKANRILLITFKTVMNAIEEYRMKLRKQRHGDRDPLFMQMDILPLFSNRMHGINANLDGYDLLITIGDPLDPIASKFASDTGIIELNKRGFRIKEDTDPAIKKEIYRTMISELLEAFHRGRSEIPIVALSNFLTPEDKGDFRMIKEMLEDDNFTLINVFVKLWKIVHRQRTPEIEVFLTSLKEELGFELK